MTAAYEFQIGTSSGSMSLLSTLNIVWPRPDFAAAAEVRARGDGSQASFGFVSASWHWDFIPAKAWSSLYNYRVGISTPIFIRTKNNLDVFRTYAGFMNWPLNEEWSVTRGLKFTLTFTALVEQSEP